MTETDTTKRPLTMPEKFIPYLEKYRIYKMFKDMLEDVIVTMPKDHLKHMKIYLGRHLHCTGDIERIMVLVSPDLNIGYTQCDNVGPHLRNLKGLVKELIKDLGYIVITRRCVMDRYEKVAVLVDKDRRLRWDTASRSLLHILRERPRSIATNGAHWFYFEHDDFVPGCVSPEMMSEVTKKLASKDPVVQAGWLMFDHPCTVREARCMQQDGVFPTVTIVLTPTPPQAPPAENPFTPARNFFEQDFEGLKFAYKATLKEVHIEPDDDIIKMSTKCFNAIRAATSGLQHTGQGYHVLGAPGVYRVVLIGPRGSGARTHGISLAKHFGLICLIFSDLYKEAIEKNDEVGEKVRSFGASTQVKAEIVRRRILQKDCVDLGWVLTGYPETGLDFENLDSMSTPPNRIIFLNASMQTCKTRLLSKAVDWCTGHPAVPGSGPRVLPHPSDTESNIDSQLDFYFSEALAELHAAAGITAVEIDANESFDHVQVKIQAAVIASPAFDIEACSQLRNVRADD